MGYRIRNAALSLIAVGLACASLALASLRICEKCGYESDEASAQCTHCGAVLPKVAPSASEAPDSSAPGPAAVTKESHILPGSAVEQEVKVARQHLSEGRAEIAKLFLRNALAMDMVAVERDAARTAGIAELLKQCQPRTGTVRVKCPTCDGSGKRVIRSTLLSGKVAGLTTGGLPAPQCGGDGFLRRAGTVADMKLALGRAASRYKVLQQARRFVQVGEAWVPEGIAPRLSLRDRVMLRRALAAPCQDCVGIGQAECKVCSATGRVKCSNRKCTGGSVTLPAQERLGRRLEQTEKCNTCGGTGVIPCEKCRGSGAVLCRSCNGSGERPPCTRCGGEGLVPCRRCGNSGAKEGAPCQTCGGARESICTSCQGDGKKR